jgi:hypothetical protein
MGLTFRAMGMSMSRRDSDSEVPCRVLSYYAKEICGINEGTKLKKLSAGRHELSKQSSWTTSVPIGLVISHSLPVPIQFHLPCVTVLAHFPYIWFTLPVTCSPSTSLLFHPVSDSPSHASTHSHLESSHLSVSFRKDDAASTRGEKVLLSHRAMIG